MAPVEAVWAIVGQDELQVQKLALAERYAQCDGDLWH